MTTFDSWEAAVRPPEDYLMHFRTPGSKNGVRRYQLKDGTWTPLGLRERKEREGWGDGGSRAERKAQKRVQKAEKTVARAERKQARKEARAQRKYERAEKKRKSKLSGLTDEEMRAKLARAKMEAEYRDLTKKGSLVETGSKLIGKYLDYRSKKEQQTIDLNRQKLEMERLKVQKIQAKEATTQARYNKATSRNEAKKAKEEARKMKADVKGGLKIQRKNNLKQTKLNYRNTTMRGALGNFLNAKAKTAGEASGEYARDQKHAKALVKAQERVDKYNAKRPKGQAKIQREETVWQRQQTEARERRANAEAVARSNAEKEKWKSRQKK